MMQRKSKPSRALVACVLALSVSVVGLPAAFADESAEVVSEVGSAESLSETGRVEDVNKVEESLQSEDLPTAITPQAAEETGASSRATAPDQRTQTYMAMGGTPSKVVKKVDYYERFTLTDMGITRPGHKLLGWKLDPDSTAYYQLGTQYNQYNNFTLYAHWEPISYSVAFNGNGGSVGTSSLSAGYGSSITLPSNATRAGYKLVGWQTSSNGGTVYNPGTSFRVTSNVTLYAKWEAVTSACTVTFDGNGGTASWGSLDPVCGSSIILASGATRAGYTLVGWQTQPNGGTVYALGSRLRIDSDITLYAKWESSVATLVFDGNGGSVSPTTMTVPVGSDYQLPSTGTRAGYNLVGWQTQPNGGTVYALGSQFRVDGNTTLYAKWAAINNTQVKILSPIDDAIGIDNYPTFTGTGQPGATVRVHGTARTLGQTTVNSDGTWSVKSSLWLPGGYYRIQATQTLLNGSVNTDAVTFQINEKGSTSTAVQVDRPAQGEVTNKEYPVFSGTGHPGSSISVRSSVRELASTTVNADGTWSVASNVRLTDGIYSVVVGQISPVGDLSNATVEFTVAVGSSAPLQITSSMSPAPGFVKFSGYGEPGAAVSIQGSVRIVGTATVGADGRWEIVSNIAFYHGDYLLTATQTCLNLDYEVKAFLLEVRG